MQEIQLIDVSWDEYELPLYMIYSKKIQLNSIEFIDAVQLNSSF